MLLIICCHRCGGKEFWASFTQALNVSVNNRQLCYLRLKLLPHRACSHTASQVGGAAAADAEQLRQQLAEAQAQLQAATTQLATLQQQLDAERTAAAGMRRQLEAGEAERNATRRAAAKQCAAAEAAQQRAEAGARDARAELAAGKAEVRLSVTYILHDNVFESAADWRQLPRERVPQQAALW